jgi:hypothetical protein
LLSVFTQTSPGPPPGLAVAAGCGPFFVVVAVVGAVVPAVDAAVVEVVVVAVVPAAAGVAAPAADALLLTPPWPLQAPFIVVPENAVPSLQVAVTVAAAGAGAAGVAGV